MWDSRRAGSRPLLQRRHPGAGSGQASVAASLAGTPQLRCRLTIHSRGCRFAAPLNSGVRQLVEDSWTLQLVGRTVDGVERWEGCPCVITLAGGFRVQIESLWRLLSEGNVLLTSGDDGQHFGQRKPIEATVELSKKLVGHSIDAFHVDPGTADLALSFGARTLQIITDSSGYEAWQVEGPGGTLAIGQGGGNVAVWD